MKNITRILCGILAVCAAAAALSGCAKPKKPAADTAEPGTVKDYDVGDALPVLVSGDLLDVNGDGSVNNKDVVIIFRKLSGKDPSSDGRYDLNQDGAVNNKDIASLFRHLTTLH